MESDRFNYLDNDGLFHSQFPLSTYIPGFADVWMENVFMDEHYWTEWCCPIASCSSEYLVETIYHSKDGNHVTL